MKKILSLLAVCILILAGCGSNSSSQVELTENVDIELWHPFTGDIEKKLTEITDKFNEENEYVNVKLVNQGSYQDLQKKLTAAKQSNTLPAMSFAYSSWEDLRDSYVDLNQFKDTENYELDFNNFVDAYMDEVKGENGEVYGVPFNKSTEVVFYNKDLAKKAGIDKAPKTMDQLFEDAQKITEKTGVTGFGADSLSNYLATVVNSCDLSSWMNQNGEFVLNDACVEQGLKLYQDGVKDGYARTAGEDQYLSGPFGSEKVASYIGSTAGASYIDSGVNGKFEWGAFPVPQKSVPQQGTNLVVYNTASKEEQMAAWQYIQYVSQDAITTDFAKSTGYLPVTKSALESKDYQEFTEKNETVKAALDETDKFGVVVPNFLGANTIYQTNFTNTMSNILDGNADIKESLNKLNDEAKAVYDRNN